MKTTVFFSNVTQMNNSKKVSVVDYYRDINRTR